MARVKALDNYLRTHRKELGLSQKEVAFLLGHRHRTRISRYERGVRVPKIEAIVALETVFQRQISKLFEGTYDRVRAEVRTRAKQLAQQIDGLPDSKLNRRKYEALVRIANPSLKAAA
jgi:transcriptional regulator with XRE-family HTH domain